MSQWMQTVALLTVAFPSRQLCLRTPKRCPFQAKLRGRWHELHTTKAKSPSPSTCRPKQQTFGSVIGNRISAACLRSPLKRWPRLYLKHAWRQLGATWPPKKLKLRRKLLSLVIFSHLPESVALTISAYHQSTILVVVMIEALEHSSVALKNRQPQLKDSISLTMLMLIAFEGLSK